MTLEKLFKALEQYIVSDIGELEEMGYERRPGSALDECYKMLDACREFKDKWLNS